ncbi:CtsR family transcriptional regulator [Planococcus glaciei]|uniref:Transcriptional regulator CtsR n=2 Tax=Planococcus TaxID=1372 RepID=A0A7H8Q8V6_9BACL|nr:CtsR family transcriptional regulator [Planococcus glaciei]ETP69698.1 CtsR family transcriptional regulator [Planococcus glaciei CHR43]KOF09389.1 CtsR family transcriptional regulator [Planococcus glaciei]MBX0316755.1 CtsR family transcriptional regulator [Planococcus glaciei]QDY45393.1 CtsR family transcriptional regulator [Planococcus glaciei]QKX50416.1 CtsR family transcriptional regulator [Planococcus glaciei]
MRNISDVIEGYLKEVIELSERDHIEIKRNEVAEKFQCVPSQINYVINTRFTVDRGYLVESKRGGGGYIRIKRIRMHQKSDVISDIIGRLENGATQSMAEDIVFRLLDEEVVSKREAKLILSAIDRSTLLLPLPVRDEVRARILIAMLFTLKYQSNT